MTYYPVYIWLIHLPLLHFQSTPGCAYYGGLEESLKHNIYTIGTISGNEMPFFLAK